MIKEQIFYVGQKALIKKDDEVLILTTKEGGIDYPGGKIQTSDKNIIDAFKREVKEEIGLDFEIGRPFFVQSIKMGKGKHEGKSLYLVFFDCKFIEGNLKISDEHLDFHWVNRDNYYRFNNGSEWFNALDFYFKNL